MSLWGFLTHKCAVSLWGFLLVVALQHNDTLDLRGCMIMQSTTWPWRTEVKCCLHQSPLLLKRTWRIGKVVLFGFDPIATACRHFVLVGGEQTIDLIMSALTLSTENQNARDHPCRRQKTMIRICGRSATWVHRLVRPCSSRSIDPKAREGTHNRELT